MRDTPNLINSIHFTAAEKNVTFLVMWCTPTGTAKVPFIDREEYIAERVKCLGDAKAHVFPEQK